MYWWNVETFAGAKQGEVKATNPFVGGVTLVNSEGLGEQSCQGVAKQLYKA